jgi:hypothetical protein
MYTLCLNDWLTFAREKLARAGFQMGSLRTISLPYYSDRARFHTLHLIEVLTEGQQPALEFEVTIAQGPLPEGAYRAALSWAGQPPTTLRPGERRTVRVRVSNSGNSVWPALGQANNQNRILAGNHWLDDKGQIVINDDARTPLPYDLAPGGHIELPLTVTAPRKSGAYVLEIDLLQEGVAWFSSKGSVTLRTALTVGE